MRRFVAIITCLALLRSAAWAQQEEPPPPPSPPPSPSPQQQPTYAYPPPPPAYAYPPAYAPRYGMPAGPDQAYRSGRRRRTVGMILTFVGVGLGALGFA